MNTKALNASSFLMHAASNSISRPHLPQQAPLNPHVPVIVPFFFHASTPFLPTVYNLFQTQNSLLHFSSYQATVSIDRDGNAFIKPPQTVLWTSPTPLLFLLTRTQRQHSSIIALRLGWYEGPLLDFRDIPSLNLSLYIYTYISCLGRHLLSTPTPTPKRQPRLELTAS